MQNKAAKQKTNDKKNFLNKCSYFFHVTAVKTSEFIGNPWVFISMLLMILVWLSMGPVFQYSDTWQLLINTSTSVITFLIVFIIQNTQNRDTKDLKIKLDELIRVHKLAHNSFIDLDKLTDEKIKQLENYFNQISKNKDDKDLTD